jgi:hypothetical protein
MNLNPMEMMETKYKAMEGAKTLAERLLAHDAANVAMNIVMSEYGRVKMLNKFKMGVN